MEYLSPQGDIMSPNPQAGGLLTSLVDAHSICPPLLHVGSLAEHDGEEHGGYLLAVGEVELHQV